MKKNSELIKDVINEVGMTSFKSNKVKNKKKKILSFKSNDVLAGIIYSEILGKPKGRRELVSRDEFKGFNSRR